MIVLFIKDQISNDNVKFDNEHQSFLSVKADLENQVAIKNELLEKFQFDLNSAKVFFLHFVFLNNYKLLIVSFIKDQMIMFNLIMNIKVFCP